MRRIRCRGCRNRFDAKDSNVARIKGTVLVWRCPHCGEEQEEQVT